MHVLLTIPWFKLEGWTIPGSSLGVHPFGALVATGVWLGLRRAVRHAERNGIRGELLKELAGYVLVAGFIFGHWFALAAYHPQKLLHEPWRLFFIWEDLSSYGGVFGSVLGGLYWSHRRKIPLLPVYDSIAYAFPLGWAFGRTGCFVVHDHPGAPTDFFLGVRDFQYPGLPTTTRHDLGLYEIFWSLAVLGLFQLLGRKHRPWGLYVTLFALLYAPFRFGLEFLRVADQRYGGLTPAHYASIGALAIGLTLLLYMQRHGHDALPPSVRSSGTKESTGGPPPQAKLTPRPS